MVLFFVSTAVQPSVVLFMGEEKHESQSSIQLYFNKRIIQFTPRALMISHRSFITQNPNLFIFASHCRGNQILNISQKGGFDWSKQSSVE